MHTLSAGWLVSVTWLWIAEIQQHLLRMGTVPPYYGAATIVSGAVPAVLLAWTGVVVNRWAGPPVTPDLERREWWHAFWWSFVPNLLLLLTVWVMIQEAQ